MKNRFFDPGFEFIFSVGIMAALADRKSVV